MLRIRLPTGNIRDFAGSEELALAVAAGEVDRDAEIYHAKSGRWVSVTGHPVFRRAAAAPAEPALPATREANGPEAPGPPKVELPAPGAEAGAASVGAPIENPEPVADALASSRVPAAPVVTDVPAAGLPADASSERPVPAPQAATPPAPHRGAAPPATPDHPAAGPPSDSAAEGLRPGDRPAIPEEPSRAPSPPPPKPGPTGRRKVARPPAEPPQTAPPVLAIQSKSGEELAARRRSRWRAPAAVIVFALALAGVLWVNRGKSPDVPEAGTRPLQAAKPARAPTPAVIQLDSAPPTSRAAPDTRIAVAPSALAGNHARLANGLDSDLVNTARQLGLNGLLATERLASSDSIGASRAALGRFSAGLVAYRARQQALSKAYNDSADAFVLTGAWDRGALQEWQVRVRRPEPPGVVARADALVAGLDSLFSLLLENRDGYEITADEIRFRAPRASLRYEDLLRSVNSNRVSPSEQISAPLTVLSQAMAGNRLPRTVHD